MSIAPARRLLLGMILCLLAAHHARAQATELQDKVVKIERMMTDGRSTEAIRAAKALTDAELARLPLSDPGVANMEAWLGSLYLRVGRFQDAYHWTHLALLHRREHLPPHAMPIGDAYTQLAKVFLESGEAASAEVQLDRAAEIYRIAGDVVEVLRVLHAAQQWP